MLDAVEVSWQADAAPPEAGNALPLLHEIRHALLRLQQEGEPTLLDLSAIPFGPGDRDRLLAALGEGEVSARIEALGPTLIRETALAGVWLVQYFDPDEQELVLHIEISHCPRLLSTPVEDIDLALRQLDDRLDTQLHAQSDSEPGSDLDQPLDSSAPHLAG
ncbi:MAG: hydrogenase expression/formation protein [Gammaproteobacteria bacterium SHHR-1]|uniref:hydrogenase expression/formation C-terminal domain-containing protein n=1 Tax=Magnetovirga frankeli TaxID=947516 RepID=UPI00327A821B